MPTPQPQQLPLPRADSVSIGPNPPVFGGAVTGMSREGGSTPAMLTKMPHLTIRTFVLQAGEPNSDEFQKKGTFVIQVWVRST